MEVKIRQNSSLEKFVSLKLIPNGENGKKIVFSHYWDGILRPCQACFE
ncbi:MAG: hypothetical protein KKB32_02335 [Acidobacteria bacterium]|nr:hypothetical protein [Acidobacteriota bacterium]